jgi:hypothetical protein
MSGVIIRTKGISSIKPASDGKITILCEGSIGSIHSVESTVDMSGKDITVTIGKNLVIKPNSK